MLEILIFKFGKVLGLIIDQNSNDQYQTGRKELYFLKTIKATFVVTIPLVRYDVGVNGKMDFHKANLPFLSAIFNVGERLIKAIRFS